ncbi:MAG: hypothetical protein AB7F64_01910 [Gammaproteobacteria bacterium]
MGVLATIILPIVLVIVTTLIQIYKHKNERINKIVEGYIQLHRSAENKGLRALVEAGMSEIKSEKEGKLVIDKIIQRISDNPLQGQDKETKIRKCGIKKFFKNLTSKDLQSKTIEEIIQEKCKK